MGGLNAPYLDLKIKLYKLLVYSSWGPSQEESSKCLRLSNLVDKDITKITAEVGAIQTETKKEHNISSMLFLTTWMSVLFLNK